VPQAVDNLIHKVMRDSNVTKSVAIAILKKKGVIKQEGKHLVMVNKEKRSL